MEDRKRQGGLHDADTLSATGFGDAPGRYRLITMRSNDQFNTTIYGYSDRLRGIEGTRDVLLINPEDMAAASLARARSCRWSATPRMGWSEKSAASR